MASLLATTQQRWVATFGNNSFYWFDRSYVFDWSLACAAWFIGWIIKQLPPFEREFSTKDPLINHAHKPNQISGDLNWTVSLVVPIVVICATGVLRKSALEVHHGFLAVFAGRGYTQLITECLKNRVGRLRPDFLSRCKWDKALKVCTGNLDKVLDGRRSFPSGHSSTAFAGATILSLWIASMTGAWCLSAPMPARSLLSTKLGRLSLSFLPLAFATWVAVSRMEDNRHHKEDVLVGSLIGTTCAAICYFIYWQYSFQPQRQSALNNSSSHARIVYTDSDIDRTGHQYGYELAGIDHQTEPV